MSSPKSVLVVEDHADSARSVARMLSRYGHTVHVAATLSEARALAATQKFNVALCDLGLPDGDGCDLMRELGARYGLKGVAITGYGMEEDKRRADEAGFSAHLIKPISMEKLLAVLDSILIEKPSDGGADSSGCRTL